MKKTFLIGAFFLGVTTVTSTAQTTDSLRAKIAYSFSHIEDTTNRDKPYREEMVLLLGKNASVYTSMDKILQDESRRKEIEEQIKNSATQNFNIQLKSSSKRTNSTDYYQFANEKKLIVKQKLINNYLIEESLPVMEWKITSDTASYSGLNCQKATTHFKGRDYIAWFCPDIPFQSGPWKLNGLPGLIIEAYDVKKEVIFRFNGFETVKNSPESIREKSTQEVEAKITGSGGLVKIVGIDDASLLSSSLISLPKDAIKTTQKEFDKLQEAMKKDPAGFINSAMAGSGVNVKTSNNNVKTGISKPVKNNPVELPETIISLPLTNRQ